ncbi:MAG: hypothetical protein ACF8NJ_10875 [Phycisphaerales bacterium JB038]
MPWLTKRATPVALCAFFVLTASGQVRERGATCIYIGPDDGVWSAAGNWDAGVPNGEFNALVNDQGPLVNVFVDITVLLHNLTIDAGNSVTLDNGRELRLVAYDGTSSILNHGTLRLDSYGSNSYLRFDPNVDGDIFELTGGGEVIASGDLGSNLITEIYGQAVLHNLDNTIRAGNLRLGYNSLEIINDSLVVADSAGQLLIDPPTGQFGFTNTGILRADGGTMRLAAGDYQNDGGVIEARNGSVVELWGTANIHGGTIRGIDGGEVQASSGAPQLYLASGYSPTIEGTLRVLNSQELRTYGGGTINNTGSIVLGSTAYNTYLRIDPDVDGDVVTLSGGGEVVASNAGPNFLFEVYGNAVLHNVDNTIRGGNLRLAYNSLEIINDGLIVADTPGLLQIDPPAVPFGFVNNGTIRADGGTLRLEAGEFDNSTGVIEALNASIIELTGTATIHGGTIRAASGGEIQITAGTPILNLSTGYTPTLEGTVRVANGKELRIFGPGTVENTGTIILDSIGGNTYLRFDPETDGDTCMLEGGGELVASGAGPCFIQEVYGQAVLHNVDNTIHGGNLRLGNNALPVINEGTIRADSDVDALIIDPPSDAIGFDNRGLLEATGTAGLTINAGPFTTSGLVTIDAVSALTRNGDIVQTEGSTTVDGTLSVSNGAFLLQGGTLTGEGAITGNVDNTGGDIAPGGSVGTLSLTGDLAQSETGALVIELGGFYDGEYDVLEITGDADLGGYLELLPVNGFVPTVGDSFTILTATGAISGWLRLPDCGGRYEIEYAADAVIVHVTGVAYPGDFNCDGCVDQSDLGILLAAYNRNDGGDIDGDGDTDQADLGELLSHYGDGC